MEVTAVAVNIRVIIVVKKKVGVMVMIELNGHKNFGESVCVCWGVCMKK